MHTTFQGITVVLLLCIGKCSFEIKTTGIAHFREILQVLQGEFCVSVILALGPQILQTANLFTVFQSNLAAFALVYHIAIGSYTYE